MLSKREAPSRNTSLLSFLPAFFSRDLTHLSVFTMAPLLRSLKSLPFGDDCSCHRMTSDSLAVVMTVTLLIVSQKFSEPGMRWVVQITIPTQAALSRDNPLLIKGHLLKAYRPSCQKRPDASTLHQSMTSLSILT